MAKSIEQLKDERRFVKSEEMPDFDKHPEYYRRMFYAGRMCILKESPARRIVPRRTTEEVADAVRRYIKPADARRDAAKWDENKFDGMMRQLLRDHTVNAFLGNAYKKNGVKPIFNKWSVFKFIGYLRIRHVYRDYGEGCSQREFEMLLEGKLNGFHSHMGQGIPNKVARAIDTIISMYLI